MTLSRIEVRSDGCRKKMINNTINNLNSSNNDRNRNSFTLDSPLGQDGPRRNYPVTTILTHYLIS